MRGRTALPVGLEQLAADARRLRGGAAALEGQPEQIHPEEARGAAELSTEERVHLREAGPGTSGGELTPPCCALHGRAVS